MRPSEGRESATVGELVAACESRAAAAGITVVTYRTLRRRVWSKKGFPQQRELMTGNDAYRLYSQLHYSPVLVCWFVGSYVSREPGREEPKSSAVVSVEAFVWHKATHHLIRRPQDAEVAFEDFAVWRAEVHCDGEDDPRVLPLHMFATRCDARHLDTEAGNRAFCDAHGNPGRRIDDKHLHWNRAAGGVYHGGGALRVAGRELAPGMHWDVSVSRGEGRVQNTQEAWRVDKRANSYANVFPNARILVPNRSSAKKVWPRRS